VGFAQDEGVWVYPKDDLVRRHLNHDLHGFVHEEQMDVMPECPRARDGWSPSEGTI